MPLLHLPICRIPKPTPPWDLAYLVENPTCLWWNPRITWNVFWKRRKICKAKSHCFQSILLLIYCIFVFIYVICVVCLFFHLSKPGELLQSFCHSYNFIGIYRQYYTVSKRPISRKLGIQWINLIKFAISSIIWVQNSVWWHFLFQAKIHAKTGKKYHICS